jgi:3-deoxy-D-manno-octulosonate 8-phosphate phosphatase KdsC-like HAD superfamily phosphatase
MRPTLKTTVEKVTAGHYAVHSDLGRFSVAKHDGHWIVRLNSHYIGANLTKRSAMREVKDYIIEKIAEYNENN